MRLVASQRFLVGRVMTATLHQKAASKCLISRLNGLHGRVAKDNKRSNISHGRMPPMQPYDPFSLKNKENSHDRRLYL